MNFIEKRLAIREKGKSYVYRISEECNLKMKELMDLFPDIYRTKSDVVRAGIISLHRWKKEEKDGIKKPK